MIVIGVLLLAAAAVVAVVGVVHNHGSGHALGARVDILGYHLSGSTGKLLLAGIIIGAVGMLGLALMIAGSRRRLVTTRALRRERREMRAALGQEPDAEGRRGRHRSEPPTAVPAS